MFPVRGCSPAFYWSEEAANTTRSIIGQDHASLNTRNTTAMPDNNTNTTASWSIRTTLWLSHFSQTQAILHKYNTAHPPPRCYILFYRLPVPSSGFLAAPDHINPRILIESRDYNQSYRSRQTGVRRHQGVRIRKKGIGGWVTRNYNMTVGNTNQLHTGL